MFPGVSWTGNWQIRGESRTVVMGVCLGVGSGWAFGRGVVAWADSGEEHPTRRDGGGEWDWQAVQSTQTTQVQTTKTSRTGGQADRRGRAGRRGLSVTVLGCFGGGRAGGRRRKQARAGRRGRRGQGGSGRTGSAGPMKLDSLGSAGVRATVQCGVGVRGADWA